MTYVSDRGIRDASSLVETFQLNGTASTRRIWCLWEERFLAYRAYLGYSALDRDTMTDEILGLNRLTAMPHPDITLPGYTPATTGAGNQYAVSVQECRPFKPKAGIVSTAEEQEIYAAVKRSDWLMADITLKYESIGYSVVEDADLPDWPENEAQRYLRIGEQQPSSSYITLPGNTLRYSVSGFAPPSPPAPVPVGLPIGFNVGKVFSTRQFHYRWMRLPYDLLPGGVAITNWAKRIWGDPSTSDYPLIGTINKYDWYGFKAGTLLIENVVPISSTSMFGGLYEWDFDYVFNHDPRGWNYKYFYRTGSASGRGFYHVSATGTYQAPGSVTDDTSLYNERDFNLLFDVRDNP